MPFKYPNPKGDIYHYWLSPDGELFYCGKQFEGGHDAWANEYLHGKPRSVSATIYLLKSGWIRVNIYDGCLYYQYYLQPKNKQMDIIEKYILDHGLIPIDASINKQV